MPVRERPLGDVLQPALADTAVDPDDTYQIAGVYSFGRGLFQRGRINGNETSYTRLNRLESGRLVMSRLKAFEGALSVIPSEFDGWFLSPEFPTFEIDATQADRRYIASLCTWPKFWSRLSGQSKGVGARRERVSAARLMALEVPLPDLPEQRRIASQLNETMSRLGMVSIKAAESAILRNALLESTIEAEEDQAEVKLDDILALERIPIEPDPNHYYVQIGIRSFGNGIFHRDKVPGNELSKLRYFEVHPNRLIVSNIMAWEGAIAVSADSEAGCVGSSRFLSYAGSDDVDLRYLNYYFKSKAGKALIRTTSTGTVVRNQTLSIKDFESLRVPLPTMDRQRKIADMLDTADRMGKLSVQQTTTVKELRDAVLNAAFTGEL
jgi:type I restriction enzyme, S subunit